MESITVDYLSSFSLKLRLISDVTSKGSSNVLLLNGLSGSYKMQLGLKYSQKDIRKKLNKYVPNF